MVSEIAEYVGSDAATVWWAVRNEDDDNLDEDQAYVDGTRGEVVNFNSFDETQIDMWMEATEAEEVDMKLDVVIATDDGAPERAVGDPDDLRKFTDPCGTWWT